VCSAAILLTQQLSARHDRSVAAPPPIAAYHPFRQSEELGRQVRVVVQPAEWDAARESRAGDAAASMQTALCFFYGRTMLSARLDLIGHEAIV